jgi:hypothetical protein
MMQVVFKSPLMKSVSQEEAVDVRGFGVIFSPPPMYLQNSGFSSFWLVSGWHLTSSGLPKAAALGRGVLGREMGLVWLQLGWAITIVGSVARVSAVVRKSILDAARRVV